MVYFNRKLEYTRDTLVVFKKEMEEKAAAAKKGDTSGGAFGGFGGFGGAGTNEKKAVSLSWLWYKKSCLWQFESCKDSHHLCICINDEKGMAV